MTIAEDLLADEALPQDIAPDAPLLVVKPCSVADVERICFELGVSRLVGQVLARRGFGDPAAARQFLTDDSLHESSQLPGAEAAAREIYAHVAAGSRIVVHGDYDVDGVCSTAILMRAIESLGGNVTWHVPSRFEDGYGLSAAALQRFSADNTKLVVVVDSGITAVQEVAEAHRLGLQVVICDHHRPGDELPDATIVHPALGDYPTPELCAAGTAYKLVRALYETAGRDPGEADIDLDLVALATVCDVVPLIGENRVLVRRGLNALRQTGRPGLLALIQAAGVDQLKIDAGTLGFRLGPRINAAGRMHSAEPAVELMLTRSGARARTLARELNDANSRRQEIEQRVLFQAETIARRQRDRFAVVVEGAEWHPGVLGIVAGRLAEAFRRPAIVLGVEQGNATGSGRSRGTYDLHAGLSACSQLLTRFGGHRAAAGLELAEADIAPFRVSFQEHAAAELSHDDLRPLVRIDAIAGIESATFAQVEELAQLSPFGQANPEPALLIPSVQLSAVRSIGDGKHARFSLRRPEIQRDGSAVTSVDGVAFGRGTNLGVGAEEIGHAVIKLKRDEWNGGERIEARLEQMVTVPGDAVVITADREQWMKEFSAVVRLEDALTGLVGAQNPATAPEPEPSPPNLPNDFSSGSNVVHDRRNESAETVAIELLLAGEDVELATHWPSRWSELATRITALVTDIRPNVDQPAGQISVRALGFGSAGEAGDLERPAASQVVYADPPFLPQHFERSREAKSIQIAWNGQSVAATKALIESKFELRDGVTELFKLVRSRESLTGEDLADRFFPLQDESLTAAKLGISLRVLEELGFVTLIVEGKTVEATYTGVDDRTQLDRSPSYCSYSDLKQEALRFLSRQTAE